MSLPPCGTTAHTPRDLEAYGRRYGLDYRVPGLSPQADTPVMRGTVREFSLRPGMQLVASDVEVLHRYDSRSRQPTPLSIIVMLEGCAQVRLARRSLTLVSGMALSLRLEVGHHLEASQPAEQRLQVLTLNLDEMRLAQLGARVPTVSRGSCLHAWRLPETLRPGLEDALATPPAVEAQHRLLLEGLGLQLLAHALLPEDGAAAPAPRLMPQELQRLERVRLMLQEDPAREHRLETLVGLAAMSPASLRRKFRVAFGRSIFEYLRECRLTLAHAYLCQGHSVQQAAHFSGYRHASNFATAFRRHFGYAPSSLIRQN